MAFAKWLGTIFEFGELHAHGVDIPVRNNTYNRWFMVEAKGESKNRCGAEVAFVYSLDQIITRMKDGRSTLSHYALALPAKSAQIAIRRIPWLVAKKLSLHIFSITVDSKVEKYNWQALKLKQGASKT